MAPVFIFYLNLAIDQIFLLLILFSQCFIKLNK